MTADQSIDAAVARWGGEAKGGDVRLTILANHQTALGNILASDTLAAWSRVYKVDDLIQRGSHFTVADTLRRAIGIAESPRAKAILGNEAARLAAVTVRDTAVSRTLASLAALAPPATGTDIGLRAFYLGRLAATRGNQTSARRLLGTAVTVLGYGATMPYADPAKQLAALSAVDLATVLDKSTQRGKDSAAQLRRYAARIAPKGAAAVQAGIFALRSDEWAALGEESRKAADLDTAYSTASSKAEWFNPNPSAGLNGALTPLRTAHINADYAAAQLSRSNGPLAGDLLSAHAALSDRALATASYQAAVASASAAQPSGEPLLNYAVTGYLHNGSDSKPSQADAWIQLPGESPPAEPIPVDLAPPGPAVSEGKWWDNSILYSCLTLEHAQRPSYLSDSCDKFADQIALFADYQTAAATLAAGLQKLFLPPALLNRLALLPKGSVLQIRVDGSLLVVPFGSFPFGSTTLGEYFELVYVRGVDPRPLRVPTGPTLVVMKSTASVIHVNADSDPLPALDTDAVAGAREVAKLTRADTLFDDSARRLIIRDRIAKYRQIHFVTHGTLDPSHQSTTGLLAIAPDNADLEAVSHPGGLTVTEIYNMRIDSADVVTLAACETALEFGPSTFSGSVAAAFLDAGAQAVVATAWKVNEASTRKFMDVFYQQLPKPHQTIITAFAAAVDSLRRDGDGDARAFVLVLHGPLPPPRKPYD